LTTLTVGTMPTGSEYLCIGVYRDDLITNSFTLDGNGDIICLDGSEYGSCDDGTVATTLSDFDDSTFSIST